MYFAPLLLSAWLASVAGGAEPAKARTGPSRASIRWKRSRAPANLEIAQQQAWLRNSRTAPWRPRGRRSRRRRPRKRRERIYRLLHQERVTFDALRELLTEVSRRERAAASAPSLALRAREVTARKPAADMRRCGPNVDPARQNRRPRSRSKRNPARRSRRPIAGS